MKKSLISAKDQQQRKAKKRHRRQKREAAARSKPIDGLRKGLAFTMLPNPLVDLSEEELASLAARVGTVNTAALSEHIERLQSILLNDCPITALKSLYVFKSLLNPNKTTQSDPYISAIELLQAIVLTRRPEEYPYLNQVPVTTTPVMAELDERLKGAHYAFALMRMKNASDAGGTRKRDPATELIQEQIRSHTQMVRVPGYPFQIDEAIADVLRRMEGTLRSQMGIEPSTILLTLTSIKRIVERRFNEHNSRMHRVIKESNPRRMVERYYQMFPDMHGSPDELVAQATEFKNWKKNIRQLITLHSAFRMLKLLEVSSADLSKESSQAVSGADASRLLGAWSLALGDLKGESIERFFLKNPVWSRPFVRLGQDKFLITNAVPHHMFPWNLIETFAEGTKDFSKRIADARSAYLEEKMSTILEARLPSGLHFRNVKWRDPISGKEFETDHICVIGCVLVVAEAKSGKVLSAALRGAVGSMKDNAYNLMEYPSIQSQRLVSAIVESASGLTITAEDGRTHVLSMDSLYTVIRINCIIDLMGLLSTRWKDLVEVGLISADAPMAPTITVFDLDIAHRVLVAEASFLHYLRRRAYIESAMKYVGDDLDLLALYLDTGFNITDRRALEQTVNLSSLSDTFNKHFMVDQAPALSGMTGYPCPRVATYWRELLHKVESGSGAGHIVASMLLRDIHPDAQVDVERKLIDTKRRLRRRRQEKENVIIVRSGHDEDPSNIVFCLYLGGNGTDGRDFAAAQADVVVERTGAKLVLVFWIDVDQDLHPYGGMGLKSHPTCQYTSRF